MDRDMFDFLGLYALRVAAAVAVLIIGHYLAGKARAVTQELIQRPEVDRALTSSIESILTRVAYYGTMLVAVILALVLLGVPLAAILSVSSVALVILAVALRESLASFAAAVMFVIYQPFRLGEEIETLGRKGIVMEMQMFSTVLRLSDRSLAVLPNSDIQKNGIINFSRLGMCRVEVPFTLRYGADIDRAREIVTEIMTSDARVFTEPAPSVVPRHLGDNGLMMEARAYVDNDDSDAVEFRLLQLMTERLIAAGLEPAVTQHDVRIESDA